jgi:hypothetical protein
LIIRLTVSIGWMNGKENIKVVNRLLFEKDVIKAVDKHTKDDDRLDDDISCILEELKSPIFVGSKEAINNLKVENKPMQRQRRVLLFENENLDLEQRGNRYYLSLYDKEGKFQREVTIDVKDDYNVEFRNCK